MLRTALLLLIVLGNGPAGATQRTDEVRDRLEAYERQAAAGREDPSELAAIASLVMSRLVTSTDPNAVIQACASEYRKRDNDCSARLWALAKRSGSPFTHRISAAATLVAHKDKDAQGYLFEIVKTAPADQLAGAAFLVVRLPPERAVPVLSALLESGNPGVAIAGCRALSEVRSSDSLKSVQEYLRKASRGTPAWFSCTLAAAKLGDPDAVRTSGFITTYLGGEDLLAAGDLLMATDPPRAVGLFLQATRETTGLTRLEAADRLVPTRPDVATDLMNVALGGQATERAGALELHRHLRLEPTREIRRLLLDEAPLVRLRAAESILAADARRTPKLVDPQSAFSVFLSAASPVR